MLACAVTIAVLSFILYSAGVAFAATLLSGTFNVDDPGDHFVLGLCALVWPLALLVWVIVQIGKFGQG